MTGSRCDVQDEELARIDPQLEDLDGNGGSFSYSQKFFHISDGNLYSVFSPLQGRSYGVKPSFLRRQRCMVQQSRGKGRKNSRRLLKFHNFIPSESVISEREDHSHELWKVHGECRLREEHGTKQIMVTNWSHSASCPASAQDDAPPPEKEDAVSEPSPGGSPPTFLAEQLEPELSLHESQDCMPSSIFSEDTSTMSENLDASTQSRDEPDRKRRRKPVVTKRIVPYSQYLSMVDSAEWPLDLSCSVRPSPDNQNTCEHEVHEEEPSSSYCSVLQNIRPNEVPPKDIFEAAFSQESLLPSSFVQRSKPALLLHPAESPHISTYVPPLGAFSIQCSENQVPQESVACSTLQSLLTGQSPGYPQYKRSSRDEEPSAPGCSKTTGLELRLPKVPRKPSHRTIIRKKLEDTFRQNGFLVKTKQVSDGDATFCKFKQLRKYTRYYLKSWHQHLPEEVHKLWKGFLPPKSNLTPNKKERLAGSTLPTNP